MLGVLATGAGCTSKQKVAREQFASAAGCPFDEVTAVERSDLSAYGASGP